MDFLDEVTTRSGRFADRLKHNIETEEATKTSFVLPFIQMLGYDIFDPSEVVPEFAADVGTKSGEKVDYALMQDGKPVILIECKRYGRNLHEEEMSQLFRYFTVTDTHFGILTDGITYRFYSDLDQPNMMDPKPFFEFNMLEFSEPQVKDLKRFTKSAFEVDETIDAARQLKYMTEIKRVIAREIAEPSDEFVSFFVQLVYAGRNTKPVREMFGSLVREAFAQFINDSFDARLNAALQRIEEQNDTASFEQEAAEEEDKPEPTELEREGFAVVKAILRETMDVRRLYLEPGQRFAIIWIRPDAESVKMGNVLCRLLFKTSELRLNLYPKPYGNNDPVNDVDSLFSYADRFREAVRVLDASRQSDTNLAPDS